VSPEIQSPSYFTPQENLQYKSFLKQCEVLNLEWTLQIVKLWFLAAENIRDVLQLVIKAGVMLSPGTTSLDIISVGRGRIPFHGPILQKSTGPRQGKSRVFKTLLEKYKTSKAEYTNTQQGLPGIGYTLSHN
jgi:hypothetical protein